MCSCNIYVYKKCFHEILHIYRYVDITCHWKGFSLGTHPHSFFSGNVLLHLSPQLTMCTLCMALSITVRIFTSLSFSHTVFSLCLRCCHKIHLMGACDIVLGTRNQQIVTAPLKLMELPYGRQVVCKSFHGPAMVHIAWPPNLERPLWENDIEGRAWKSSKTPPDNSKMKRAPSKANKYRRKRVQGVQEDS